MEKLKDFLINKPDIIKKVLEQMDFHKISFNSTRNEIRCATKGHNNPTTVAIKVDTLQAINFSSGAKGLLFHIIADNLSKDVKEVVYMISVFVGYTKKETDTIFNGAFNGFYRDYKTEDSIYAQLDKKCLNEYSMSVNDRFKKDYITYGTQQIFNIGYDYISDRISVPWFSENGDLVGVMGRINIENSNFPKWYPLIPFNKSNHLFGLFQNKQGIQKSRILFIGESEKFTMQLSSYNINCGVSLGGCNISKKQAALISNLDIDRVIVCLDEGITEAHIRDVCETLKLPLFNHYEIYYIYDKNNIILEKYKKQAPTDLGKDKFIELLNKCLYRYF